MNRVNLWLATCATTIAVLGASTGLAYAQTSSTPAKAATVTVSTAPRMDRNGKAAVGQLWVTARIVGPDGKPIGNQSVTFYQTVDLFGSRRALLDTAMTNSAGEATILYEVAQSGPQQISARTLPKGSDQPIEGSVTTNVTQNKALFENDPLPLASIRMWLPLVLVGVVVATWLVLLTTFFGAIRTIRSAGQQAPATP